MQNPHAKPFIDNIIGANTIPIFAHPHSHTKNASCIILVSDEKNTIPPLYVLFKASKPPTPSLSASLFASDTQYALPTHIPKIITAVQANNAILLFFT